VKITKKRVRQYIKDTVKRYGIQTRGYMTEYKIVKYGENWDGEFYTLSELIDKMIAMEKGTWDIWVGSINPYGEPPFNNTMCYIDFDLNELTK